MTKIIIANWKANPASIEEAIDLLDFCIGEISKYPDIKLVVCPPLVYLEELFNKLKVGDYKLENISLGSQDVFADMSNNFGVTHILVGHSDRRYKVGESDEVINKKIKAVLSAGITPVFLVGEQNQDDNRQIVLEQQLSGGLAGLAFEQLAKILIAYEPVWAISTNPNSSPDTPSNTLKAIEIIKNFLNVNYKLESRNNFLYGGSINEKNIKEFLRHPEIFGAVVGGASLREEEFANILKFTEDL